MLYLLGILPLPCNIFSTYSRDPKAIMHYDMPRFVIFVMMLPVFLEGGDVKPKPLTFNGALTGVSNSLGVLSGLAGLYDFASNHIRMPEEHESNGDFVPEAISVTEEMEQLKKSLSNLREEIRFDAKIDELVSLINDIEYAFNKYYGLIKHGFRKTVNQNYYTNSTYEKYADNIISYNSGFERRLDRMKDVVVSNSSGPALSTLQLRVLESKELTLVCKTKQSPIQIIGELLGKIVVVESKGTAALLLAYDIYEWLGKGNFSEVKRNAERESLNRYNQLKAEFQKAAKTSTNQLYVCDPETHVRGVTYFELGNDPFHREDYENECSEHLCSILRMARISACPGTEVPKNRDCTPTYQNPSIGSLIIPEHSRHLQPPGHPNTPCYNILESNMITKFYEFAYRLDTCHFCVCDSSKYKYKVSLSFTSSQVSQNYVITGARLRIEDNVIYVQLQEGQLGPFGSINETTLRWIPVNKDDDLTMPLSVYDNRFDLDGVAVPQSNVVTGVRIFPKKYDFHSQRFGLNLEYARINYTTGYLDGTKMGTVDSSTKTRNYILLAELGNPISTNKNTLDSVDTNYVILYSSSETGGTVPYIDLQDVVSKPSTPLSGLGFIHKGTSTSAGFLGLSIYTYDISPHVQ